MHPSSSADQAPDRVGIIGLGLIGGSIARRLNDTAPVGSLTTTDVDPGTRDSARSAGVPVTDAVDDLIANSSLLLLAVPLPALGDLLPRIEAVARPGTVVTDVTSVKVPVATAMAATGLDFVGAHPMTGTEASGFAAADPALLDGARWALCLDSTTSTLSWLRVARLIASTGGVIVPCTAADHDDAVAAISHLPHLVAAATARGAGDRRLALGLAAGSFRDVTRVAGTRAALSTAMCAGNAEPVASAARAVAADLSRIADALDRGDVAEITQFFTTAHDVRQHWPPPNGSEETINGSTPDIRNRLLALGRTGGYVSTVGATQLTVRTGPEYPAAGRSR